MITYVGVLFPTNFQFGPQEHVIFNSVKSQIEQRWPNGNNLLVNLTWFGPQFKNGAWEQVQDLIAKQKTFDRIIWLCAIDPLCVLPQDLTDMEQKLHSKENYYVGVGFDGALSFNTHVYVLLEEFEHYTVDQLKLTEVVYPFVNYNRKPKPHRIQLAERLNKLDGIVTLGKIDSNYNVNEGMLTDLFIKMTPDISSQEVTHNGKYTDLTDCGGVPYDLYTLGRLDIWQQHFLNIVSETVYRPWDTTFVTEKTWKPIIGLRPFLINGQTQIYQWLRDRGFRTFNQYWSHIPVEQATDVTIYDLIYNVADYLCSLSPEQLQDMWHQMLPDLLHNRQRFFEFAQEEIYKMNHLFDESNN